VSVRNGFTIAETSGTETVQPARSDNEYVIDHVQLAMPPGREDDARAFYGELLGFDEVAKPPALAARGGVWFRAGATHLHLGVEQPFVPAKKAHPALRCARYEALVSRLARCAVVVTPDPLLLDGKPHCYIEDPFGNRIELIDGS
jgi:catechol 2,3-dioxygenase-like lactoylglutathione lyase family enzyme